MKTANGCLALCLAMLLGCKGMNFAQNRDSETTTASSESARAETLAPEEAEETEEAVDTVDAVALEPISVGGAFLGCFVDPQIDADLLKDINPGTDSVAVGCQAFDDANFSRVLGRGSLVMESATIQSQTLTFTSVDNHLRWSWLTRVPSVALQSKLSISIRASADAVPIQLQVELLDILPASIAMGPLALSQGTYKLRVKGSGLCLTGNAAWAYDTVARKPVTESLRMTECSTALSFRFSNFDNGWRLSVPHPAPPSCDLNNTPAEYCGQSCIDLEDFGLGTRFVLWACTLSVEAQSYVLTSAGRGAVRLQANGRFVSMKDNAILPDLDAAMEFEIVPSALSN
ncbi:hypothetical protein [Oligoflexus tunisiensis]|uniref:hypothetical protein n=1 Tax=Oligoflexus tunisiensis TaxID=708132 RepID=UPI00114D0674|nr:hypothetical protein [Oligoflexus tunisiensis]